jgi:hypothetical protein
MEKIEPVRKVLPHRRLSTTVVVEHADAGGTSSYIVTFGYGPDYHIYECFCTSPRGDKQAFINDACIAISLLLQHGIKPETLERAFGENRPIDKPNEIGPPSSPLGAIAREAARIERELWA